MDDEVALIRNECHSMAQEVKKAIQTHAIVHRKDMGGEVFAYETDGYGSTYFMDDANIPSLLSWVKKGFNEEAVLLTASRPTGYHT